MTFIYEGHLKIRFIQINELKDNIKSAIESLISAKELLKVNINFIRCQQSVGNNGGHFQHQM